VVEHRALQHVQRRRLDNTQQQQSLSPHCCHHKTACPVLETAVSFMESSNELPGRIPIKNETFTLA
jgi:hypothetical protein